MNTIDAKSTEVPTETTYEQLVELGLAPALPVPAEPKVSLKDRLAMMAKPVTFVGTTVASATGTAVAVVGEKWENRQAVKASSRNYRQSTIIPEGRAIRQAFRDAKAQAKAAKTEGGEK